MHMFPNAETIKTNGVKLEVFHKGQGSPIVLCHGWPEHAYSWRHQIDPLVEAGYHVIIPNQRGYGNSSIPQEVEDYDIAHLTGDLLGLLDHFGYQDAVFVGHDKPVYSSGTRIHGYTDTRIYMLAREPEQHTCCQS